MMDVKREAEVPRLSALGSSALLFEAPGALSIEHQRRIWWIAQEAASWPHVQEAVPGMNNLMLTFTRPPENLRQLESFLRQAWNSGQALQHGGRVIELPVVYGGQGGPHMADVVAHTGLSVDRIVELHSKPLYTVYALGSHPGYCYLGGMDPSIATPRRAVPVINLPGGSVSIGGIQTGVSASAGPSGWNTIGRTSLKFFDPNADPPALFAPGDMIRFTVEDIEP
jgi:5-oxoprolinase (ATP-hydrolysing) subunit B